MAGSRIWRRRALAAAVIAVTAMGSAACGSSDKPGPASSTGGGDSVIGGAPTGSATPGSAATTGTNGGGGGGTNGGAAAPTYPKDAKTYVQELLKAMAAPDYTRISQLAVQAAVQQFKENVASGGNPNSQWPYLVCTPNTGPDQSTCVARNSHGDELTIKVNQLQLGFPTAVTDAPLDRTTYPSSPAEYVGALLLSYERGNQQRMVRLSSDTVKGKITCSFGKQITTTPIDGTYSKVTVNGLGVDLGKMYEFKILTAPGGKANAVKEVLSKQC